MERKFRISDADSRAHFGFKVSEAVRVIGQPYRSGKITDELWVGEYPAGSYRVWHEIRPEDGFPFIAEEMTLETA